MMFWSEHKFIVIEGIDGVGKSTVCRMVQSLILKQGGLCELLYGVPEPYIEIAMKVPQVKSVYSRYNFYHASNLATADKVRDILHYSNVVLDRYCYSTFAYHRARGANIPPPVFTDSGLLKPHLSVLLKVGDEAIRQDRIEHRDQEKSLDDQEKNGAGSFIDELEKLFGLLSMVEVDNSADDPGIAAQRILNTLSDSDGR
ncbi:hypothetical protein [Magnetospirillum sulfuroxidans]|uniref:Thymidylate kinase-like domain-containing protein n=1 Tax=Magnetospirillum sulfuroxidans TaxID=611300 RepID=A0ABS5ICG8_9PROT|nr:hypothetical protein [Magnetospirillum sulfuroxidans]MBR9972115.1 hypothetical protein [Magnetospirillum sulfuroxidans]